MSTNKTNLAIALLTGIFIVLVLLIGVIATMPANAPGNSFGDVNTGNYDTVTQGIISTTSTVNTTATLMVAFGTAFTASTTNASATKWATIFDNGTSSITCAMDDRGTTAPSSTVAINRGFILSPFGTSSSIPSFFSVGQCSSFYNCIPAMGNVSCLSNSGAAVPNVSVIRK